MSFFIKKEIQDIILAPFTHLSAIWLKKVRANIRKMKVSKKILFDHGVFPILDTYWEPLFNPKNLRHSLREDRSLPGIDFNIEEQLKILKQFSFTEELKKLPLEKTCKLEFYYENGSFEAIDAEYLYSMIRLFKPKRIIEIGSGNSTLMAINALEANKKEDREYKCEHICIEPYECEWLKNLPVCLVEKRVEELDKQQFLELERNDLLFIDSSHIIRPQGDVLVEILEILPILKSGVIVHIHDIFTPKDYWDDLIIKDIRFWNEQYLLEAFLTFNKEYKIIGSLNFLKHHHYEELVRFCPMLKEENDKEPGSFYIMKK